MGFSLAQRCGRVFQGLSTAESGASSGLTGFVGESAPGMPYDVNPLHLRLEGSTHANQGSLSLKRVEKKGKLLRSGGILPLNPHRHPLNRFPGMALFWNVGDLERREPQSLGRCDAGVSPPFLRTSTYMSMPVWLLSIWYFRSLVVVLWRPVDSSPAGLTL